MIRVLRLLEYEFPNYEYAEKHLGQCFVSNDGMPKEMGTDIKGRMKIRSTILVTPFSVTPDTGEDNASV